MSGPKRAVLYVAYDPTPARLNDLRHFAAKQDRWLERHGPFVRHWLGAEAFSAAVEARRQIDECIQAGDPDGGFDCYGRNWSLFNQAYRSAADAKRQQEYWERQQRMKRQRAAARLVAECKAVWEDAENQALLRRWASSMALCSLATSLGSLAGGPPEQVQREARAWRGKFEKALSAATRASDENARAVQSRIPKLREAIDALGKLDADILPDAAQFRLEKDRLQQRADDAVIREDLRVLHESIASLNELAAVYEQKVRQARFRKATDAVRAALSKCGYSVASRTEAGGTVVLQASGFPFRSVNVEMDPGTDEMKLDVNDERGTHCVKDVQSLQAELARQGMELRIIDWGKGRPQSINQHLEQGLRLGGTR